MQLTSLIDKLNSHHGEFLCESFSGEKKKISFYHLTKKSLTVPQLPDCGRLTDFYDTFGSILFYLNPESGDAARYIAPIHEWEILHNKISRWFVMDEEEREEILPGWIDTALVLGNIPGTGNFILMPTEGSTRGHIYEFDHDGFEFFDEAPDLVTYAERLLRLDLPMLANFASHMRFITETPDQQWIIRGMSDNRSKVLHLES